MEQVLDLVKDAKPEEIQKIQEKVKQAVVEVSDAYLETRQVVTTEEGQMLLDKAFALSLIIHAGQPRSTVRKFVENGQTTITGDPRPYSIHVAGVARLLLGEFQLLKEVSDSEQITDILAAVWLHDVIEDGQKGARGKTRLGQLVGDEKGEIQSLRGELGGLIHTLTNSEVVQIVKDLSKPDYEALPEEDMKEFGISEEDKKNQKTVEIKIEKGYYLKLGGKHIGTQLIKAADFAFNLDDLKNHPDRRFPQGFFLKRLEPVIGSKTEKGFLEVAKFSSQAKYRLLTLIQASVDGNNRLNRERQDPQKAPLVLTQEQESLLVEAFAKYSAVDIEINRIHEPHVLREMSL